MQKSDGKARWVLPQLLGHSSLAHSSFAALDETLAQRWPAHRSLPRRSGTRRPSRWRRINARKAFGPRAAAVHPTKLALTCAYSLVYVQEAHGRRRAGAALSAGAKQPSVDFWVSRVSSPPSDRRCGVLTHRCCAWQPWSREPLR